MKSEIGNYRPACLIVVLASLMLSLSVPAGAVPPERKHYATVFVVNNFAELPLTAIFDCMSFTRIELCLRDGACGTFRFTEEGRRQNRWEAEIEFVDDSGEEDELVHATVRGITENVAQGSSISGTALLERAGVVTNTGVAGTQTNKRMCQEFADLDSQ